MEARSDPQWVSAPKYAESVLTSCSGSCMSWYVRCIGPLRKIGDVGVRLCFAEAGHGNISAGGKHEWILES